MKLFLKKNENLEIPKAAYPNDKMPSAGYDVKATSEPIFAAEKSDIVMIGQQIYYRNLNYIEYKTSLYYEPEQGVRLDNDGKHIINYHLEFAPRSSISKTRLILANSVGLLDGNYRGEVCARFKYYFAPSDLTVYEDAFGNKEIVGKVNANYIYKCGDFIAQLIARQTEPIHFELVDNIGVTQRNAGGFGSSTQ